MAVLRIVRNADNSRYGYRFDCPGCDAPHVIPVKPNAKGWDFNEDEIAPTFSPSILVRWVRTDPEEAAIRDECCHSFVRDGQIQFLSDCTHQLAGQTVPLQEIENEN